jgi:hypothetical protein
MSEFACIQIAKLDRPRRNLNPGSAATKARAQLLKRADTEFIKQASLREFVTICMMISIDNKVTVVLTLNRQLMSAHAQAWKREATIQLSRPSIRPVVRDSSSRMSGKCDTRRPSTQTTPKNVDPLFYSSLDSLQIVPTFSTPISALQYYISTPFCFLRCCQSQAGPS